MKIGIIYISIVMAENRQNCETVGVDIKSMNECLEFD